MENMKEKILRKFGTLTEFCRVADINRGSIDYMLESIKGEKPKDRAMKMLIEHAYNRFDSNKIITKLDLEKLWDVINRNYDSNVSLFCKLHGFEEHTVYQILKGKRKRKTHKVLKVLSVKG